MPILQQRSKYWANSKLSEWLLKTFCETEKPSSATLEDWGAWRKRTKAKNKFVYWIAEDLFDDIQSFVYYPVDVYHHLRCKFLNRYVDKLHYLKTGLPAGEYNDVDTRILHGLFTTLVDFIEVEKAHHNTIFCGDSELKKEFPFWSKNRFFRWNRLRSAKSGLAHLDWEMALVDDETGEPTSQAIAAKEQFELYNWWTVTRPARKDPYEYETVAANLDWDEFLYKKQTPEDIARRQRGFELEEQYSKEDDDMLIRLVKIRRNLWT